MKEMDERNAFDILLDYPRDKRLAFDTHESTNRAFRIYKKDWLDRFLRFKKRKTGMKRIDRYYTITSRSKGCQLRSMKNPYLFFNRFMRKFTLLHCWFRMTDIMLSVMLHPDKR